MNGIMDEMAGEKEIWRDRIAKVREENIFHPGEAGKTAADYIIGRLTGRRNPEKTD